MLALAAFIVGLLLGSFLNVCIARLPHHHSIAKPRSHCPHCKHPIRWYDNIPLLSYLFLRTRCRDCSHRISALYPVVEFLYATWFTLCVMIAVGNRYGALDNDFFYSDNPLRGITLAIFGFLLLGLAATDWKTHTLPEALTLPGIFLGWLLVCVQAFFLMPNEDNITLRHPIRINAAGSGHSTGNVFLTGPEHLVLGRIVAILGAFGLLYLIRTLYKAIRKRDGMGLGDATLLAMIAAFLGFSQSLIALFAGVLLASAFGIWLLLNRGANRLTRLPFGTFLCIGGFIASIFGPGLVGWYTSLFQ